MSNDPDPFYVAIADGPVRLDDGELTSVRAGISCIRRSRLPNDAMGLFRLDPREAHSSCSRGMQVRALGADGRLLGEER
jgi:hypothetical protein